MISVQAGLDAPGFSLAPKKGSFRDSLPDPPMWLSFLDHSVGKALNLFTPVYRPGFSRLINFIRLSGFPGSPVLPETPKAPHLCAG